MKRFVDVIVPLPIAGLFTYSLPEGTEQEVSAGSRVVVSFGRKKYYTAIVERVHDVAPVGYETKDILEVLDRRPVLLAHQLDFWRWIAEYYLCTLGDVYKAALPSGMKLESESVVVYNEEFQAARPLSEKEQRLLHLLAADPEQSIGQLEKGSGLHRALPLVRSLLEQGAVTMKEELKRSYKPRMETRVRLTDALQSEEALHAQFEALDRAPQQLKLLMKYLELSGWMHPHSPLKEVARRTLLQATGLSDQPLNALVRKQVFELYACEVGRLQRNNVPTVSMNPLNEAQQRAYEALLQSFAEKQVTLLHGVTSSGKTEIYIHLIGHTLQAGRQVLYLLPEIALTAQITERLKRVFGDRLGIYHSKFPDAERVEIWQKQLSDHPYEMVVGVRSSVFLPFQRLGLVIVDEEHENTYKQQEPAPRYHARNAAIVLAAQFGAKTVLGTATPSIETYYNACSGKYGHVELTERYQHIELPRIELVDIQELHRKKLMTAQFSPYLLLQIRRALDQHEQVILFQNRRGFAPMVECRTCGWVPRCQNCDVSLTYHKSLRQLTCHYCGYTYSVPPACPACGSTELMNRGFGTEKIEDDIRQLFPTARVARMDLDTTRTRTAYERIIADFEQGKTDILIGTQMVSKGLDFDRVSVVGILNADSLLNYPDFRSYERAYQLMAQVAGRAGRKHRQGLVVLQTRQPELPLIRQVIAHDYEQMYHDQLSERQLFRYPPFYRLAAVYLKHRKEDVLDRAAVLLSDRLRQGLGDRVLGPDRPPVSRIQTLYIRKLMIKIEQSASLSKVREYLLHVQRELLADERFRSLIVYYDMDPM